MHCSGRSYFESVRFIKSKEVETNIETDINKKLIPKDEWQEFDSSVVSRLHNNLMLSDRAKSYFVSRKIVGESLNKFILGYSDKQDMVTVPVHSPEGILVGFVGRSIEGKDFKNTPGLPKSKLLFNLHRVKNANRVYVVESSFDVMRLNQVGLPAVATLGANVSYRQIDLLQKYFSDIMIIADNDEAGGNMKEKIIEKLGSHVSVININKQYKDIGDMDDMSIKELDLQFDKSIMSMLK
jgi:5S rRNA maturation endonuclease (ribonuclease M5)